MTDRITKILHNPLGYLKSKQTIHEATNIVIDESNRVYNLLTSDQKQIIDNKYGKMNLIRISRLSDNNLFLTSLFIPQELRLHKAYEKVFFGLVIRLYDMINLLNNNIVSTNNITTRNNIEPTKNIIIEDNNNNYGHNDIIWEGNVNFPIRLDNYPIKSSNNYYGQYGGYYGNNESNGLESIRFDKQAEIDRALKAGELNPISNQKQYFQLFRFGYKNLNKPNNNSNEPTIALSLFAPNSVLHNPSANFSDWTNKYLITQVKFCVVFNYYFPNGNYRNYFDYYMLKKFSSLNGNDTSLKITDKINKFDHFDFEDEEGKKVNIILEQFYTLLKQKEDEIEFENGLERFLFLFDFACRCYNNNGTLEIRDKTGDFFVYKMNGPFIENQGKINEGHITDGYIGQHIRYLSLKQQDYTYNNEIISKPTHLVWRDNHANCIAYNDSKWIKKLNEINEVVYFLPNSLGYMPSWNDYAKCTINNKYYTRSAIAGVVQMRNPEFYNDNELYIKTIGMPFIMNKNTLPLKLTRENGYHGANPNKILNEYLYGIDEYTLTQLFNNDKIKKRLILFNYKLEYENITNFRNIKINENINNYFYYLQTGYIIVLNYLKKYTGISTITYMDFIKKVEEIRNGSTTNKALGFLLSLIPNKYQLQNTIFGYTNHALFNTVLNIDEYINEYLSNLDNIKKTEVKSKMDNITFENLRYFDLDCKSAIIINSYLEWCQGAYIGKKNININECPPENYYSGFYNELPPQLDIGILRQPSDLIYCVQSLNKNKLKIPLNKSDYKLKSEKGQIELIPNIVEDNNTGKISDDKLNKIFNDLSKPINNTFTSFYLPDFDQFKSQLIWKALNYRGYDIPPQWFNNVVLKNEQQHKLFNTAVKNIIDYRGEDDILNILGIDKSDDKYKMAVYLKYLKYKKKYNLLLKQ